MKTLALLAAVGALQLPLAALGMRATVGFNDKLLAGSNVGGVSFGAMLYDLSTERLMAQGVAKRASIDAYPTSATSIFGPDGHVMCAETNTTTNTGEVTVVLAFSKCLNDTALDIVDQWISQVKSSVGAAASEEGLSLNFQSTMVPGACEERVISFVTGATSYGEVMQYENSLDVSKTFNFQICNGGTNCNGVFENCIQLPEAVDLFMYNPFTVTRLLQC
ncbi:hypothetical protein BBJ28_00023200, partial [Nothophytophthora sp. Chile5]